VGYDIQLIQVPVPSEITFPIDESAAKEYLANPILFDDLEAVKVKLLEIDGTRPGPENSIDYFGQGLNYARFRIDKEAIHMENNCGARELLKMYHHVLKSYPTLLIYDLQSKQLHSAISFEEWWSRPL